MPDHGTVDVTTRRVRQFLPPPGTQCYWRNFQLPGNEVVQTGQTTPSDTGIVTLVAATVTKAGNRLVISTSTPADEQDHGVPVTPTLSRPTPNPFLHETSIHYTMPRAAKVEVGVYTLVGEKVRTLKEGTVGQGTHVERWNGTDALGAPVPAGVYAVRLTTADGDAGAVRVIRIR
jgi:hypothetical protein